MERREISTEDELLAHYLQNYAEKKERVFPKVHTISTLRISPDIDLLFINKRLRLTVGYEFKLLRYHKGWKRVNYNPLYAGIGEALLYFQHGIDKCYLLLGLAKMPSEWVDATLEKLEEVVHNFAILTELFSSWSDHILHYRKESLPKTSYLRPYDGVGDSKEKLWGFGCFGIMVWTERDGQLQVRKNADQHFPVSKYPDLQHKKECLLREEFKYRKISRSITLSVRK